uniref:Uncharacterized protein n=1 Tax=Anguilla anguilla TaxID=7936 RepID=A0A0E9XF43_ANGAN
MIISCKTSLITFCSKNVLVGHMTASVHTIPRILLTFLLSVPIL